MALCYSMDSVLLLYLLSSLTVPTFAMLSQLSQITPRASMLNLVSPPNPLITRAATVDGNLFARGIATCGYISGNGASPLTCPAGYTCTSTVQDVVGWACCNQIQCVGNYRTCADYGLGICSGNLDPTACSSIYVSILSCSDSAAPSCFVYARSTHIGAFQTAYSFGCGASGGTVLALATTTTAGEAVSASSTSTNYFPTAATTDNINPSLANNSPSSAASSPASSSSSDSGLNTGSIIGIIIAAVGTLGTLVGAYYTWKAVQRRRDRDPLARNRALRNDGGGVYSTVRPAYGQAQGVYAAPRPVAYGHPPSYAAGQAYSNGWR